MRFSDALDVLRRDGVRTYLELDPGEVPARTTEECPTDDVGTTTPSAVLTVTRDRELLLGG
ncbi:hypothetical protein E4N62_41360 [Streptomyces sp. MNU76]|uniref:hypothetical protein n=1 Tax=Streptomyces sp. MNU76 TaxID=2560026 RepID=UPI001E479D5B|nr:hypothetical protein [Streptomyces sp. MNU76]MCC9711115.1 hypothetical protein [Streptomyces sp. MNU76]